MTDVQQTTLNVRALHQEAMEQADLAELARRQNDELAAFQHTVRAFELESQAAGLVAPTNREPTRSVLHRSAATLALECKRLREAERLVATALAGDPPEAILNELRDLLERIHFERHLELRGIALQSGEVQVSLTGDEVSFGMVLSDLAVERVKDIEKLIIRTAERKRGLPYRKAGRPKGETEDLFKVYISVPRAASFAFTLRLGTSGELFGQQDDVVNEVLECVDLVNANKLDELRERIPDETYLRNFIGLSQKIAPDGEQIKMVGFTAVRPEGERRTTLTRTKREISTGDHSGTAKSADTSTVERNTITLEGVLGYANSLRQTHAIRLKMDSGRTQTVLVPEGLMDDIVRPYWHKRVVIRAFEAGNGLFELDAIHEA